MIYLDNKWTTNKKIKPVTVLFTGFKNVYFYYTIKTLRLHKIVGFIYKTSYNSIKNLNISLEVSLEDFLTYLNTNKTKQKLLTN